MTGLDAESGQRAQLNPAAIPLEEAARLLSRVGGQPVAEQMLEADRAAGAPQNADGSLNLVRYAAWLVQEMNRGD